MIAFETVSWILSSSEDCGCSSIFSSDLPIVSEEDSTSVVETFSTRDVLSSSVSVVDGTSCLSDWWFETAVWIVSVIAVIGAVTTSRRLSNTVFVPADASVVCSF